ncbi:T179A-like protein [Mya arenaria]|uniref:T179A-like protein n=1 Tax=Mya arenaria TaxID=6604 RepID=A0ABY7G7A0_MYAAR|nr:T179A-like protein [Mya arenaria]
MGLHNLTVLFQITAFLLSFILSFFIFIPLAVNQYRFNAHCLLYASGHWNTSDISQLTDITWGPNSACGFGLFIGIVLMLVTLFYICLDALHLSWLDSMLTGLVSLVLMLMLFSESITISVGFKEWCNLLTNPPSEITSCELAEYVTFYSEDKININNFYTHMKMAEFGSWSNFICWLFLFVTSFYKLVRYQRHETFMASVNRERERLVQKFGPRNRAEYMPVPT